MARKAPSPKAPLIDAPIVVDAGDPSLDRAPVGAHVSIAGGTWEAAARAREISATGAQLFTKQANRWAEREIVDEERQRFAAAMHATHVRFTCAHDSYLINLASPDDTLRARSLESFRAELRRCHALGLDALVSHPGNYIDTLEDGIARNADAITAALEAERGTVKLLLELTAGQGTVLGGTFEEMAQLIAAIPASLHDRIGVCLDTAHVWAAGYDLVTDYDGVMAKFDDVLGLDSLGCLHLNDSKARLGSHLDRHELIGDGALGDDVFRRIMTDERLAHIPKIIETPKGTNPAETDGRMLRKLRAFAAGVAASFILLIGIPEVVGAQETQPRFHLVGEAGVTVGGTWHEGQPGPTVSSTPGVFAGIGAQRVLSQRLVGGFVARLLMSGLSIEEGGEQWKGNGRVFEGNFLFTLSVPTRTSGEWRAMLDMNGGVNALGGPSDLQPFRHASRWAPMGEIGVTLSRGSASAPIVRSELALFARYNLMQTLLPDNSTVSSGTTGRMLVGMRIVR